VTGVKMAMRIQPMIPVYGVKKSTSDERYPISHRSVPRPRVSLIHGFIPDLLPLPVLVLYAKEMEFREYTTVL